MKHTEERDTRDARYDCMFLGEVVENVDPEKHDRVRVLVPGLLEPKSRWCFPMGSMFGVKNGIHWVPEVGANVIVFLNQGDVDHPYYMAGPWGAPDGTTDQGDHHPQGSVDHMSIRWRGFHLTLDGTQGQEKLTLEDLDSGTKLEVDKTTGDFLRSVRGSEVVAVKTNRSITVEEGDEAHNVSVGKRTTTIEGNDEKTLTTGDEVKTLSAGNKTQTLVLGSETKTLAAGGSTESMPAGTKTITALAISLNASGAVNVVAGGAVSIAGAGVSQQSTAGGATVQDSSGTTLAKSTGLYTENFLGGFTSAITGAFTRVISGVATWTLNGAATFLGAAINLGLGAAGYKRLATEDFVLNIYNAHTHGGVAPGAGSTGVPSVLGTTAELTSNTKAS